MNSEKEAILPSGTGVMKKTNKPMIGRFSLLCFAFSFLVVAGLLYTNKRSDEGTPVTIQTSSLGNGASGGGGINSGAILVLGATGRTGSRLYHKLKRGGDGTSDVRAFVRDVEKARTELGCDACDETEGIYVGDVTTPNSLDRAMADGAVSVLAIAVGASPSSSKDIQRAVEFDGVVSSVESLARNCNNKRDMKVVLCSSMGTTETPSPVWSGDIYHWKINAEAFLLSSGIPSVVIVKPCGLTEEVGEVSTLVVGHHDTMLASEHLRMSRDDLANVMAEAVEMPSRDDAACDRIRFDLCSRPGPYTGNLKGLIENSRWSCDK